MDCGLFLISNSLVFFPHVSRYNFFVIFCFINEKLCFYGGGTLIFSTSPTLHDSPLEPIQYAWHNYNRYRKKFVPSNFGIRDDLENMKDHIF